MGSTGGSTPSFEHDEAFAWEPNRSSRAARGALSTARTASSSSRWQQRTRCSRHRRRARQVSHRGHAVRSRLPSANGWHPPLPARNRMTQTASVLPSRAEAHSSRETGADAPRVDRPTGNPSSRWRRATSTTRSPRRVRSNIVIHRAPQEFETRLERQAFAERRACDTEKQQRASESPLFSASSRSALSQQPLPLGCNSHRSRRLEHSLALKLAACCSEEWQHPVDKLVARHASSCYERCG
jgi:hypothetical protein